MPPIEWNIGRELRPWSELAFNSRLAAAPEKIEYDDGIFISDRQRLLVLGMLLENLGMEAAVRFGSVDDWEAAVRARREAEDNTSRVRN